MTTRPMPEGWERVDADEGVVKLLELLHPTVSLELGEPLYVGASEGCTGALFANPNEQLRVRSIGNNVAHVEHADTRETALVQVPQLVACQPRPWSSGA